MSFDYTGCGVTGLFCHTAEAPAAGTMKTAGTFHFITANSTPGILVTPEHTSIICAGFSTTVTGNVIGTITNPECGESSKRMTISFNSNNIQTQEHKLYTGISYSLTSQTGTAGTIKEFGWTELTTTESTTVGTLDCT